MDSKTIRKNKHNKGIENKNDILSKDMLSKFWTKQKENIKPHISKLVGVLASFAIGGFVTHIATSPTNNLNIVPLSISDVNGVCLVNARSLLAARIKYEKLVKENYSPDFLGYDNQNPNQIDQSVGEDAADLYVLLHEMNKDVKMPDAYIQSVLEKLYKELDSQFRKLGVNSNMRFAEKDGKKTQFRLATDDLVSKYINSIVSSPLPKDQVGKLQDRYFDLFESLQIKAENAAKNAAKMVSIGPNHQVSLDVLIRINKYLKFLGPEYIDDDFFISPYKLINIEDNIKDTLKEQRIIDSACSTSDADLAKSTEESKSISNTFGINAIISMVSPEKYVIRRDCTLIVQGDVKIGVTLTPRLSTSDSETPNSDAQTAKSNYQDESSAVYVASDTTHVRFLYHKEFRPVEKDAIDRLNAYTKSYRPYTLQIKCDAFRRTLWHKLTGSKSQSITEFDGDTVEFLGFRMH